MLKKIMLALATFAVIFVVFQIYQWQEDDASIMETRSADPSRRTPDPGLSATNPAGSLQQAIEIRGTHVDAGEGPVFRMYDRKGNAKIVFRAARWDMISDNEMHMVEPRVRLLLPDGQLAYVRADEGQVTVQKADNDNLDPKSGWLRGHVFLSIDLTRPEWRKNHPELAEREQHPESVVKIWLDDVRFDLDMTLLVTDGPILLQSSQGTLKGQGLSLVWNEVDRRVKSLTIAKGERATLRNIELDSLAMTGADGAGGADEEKSAGDKTFDPADIRIAGASVTDEAPRELTFHEPGQEADKPREDRVDTYRVTFSDDVLAEQKDGLFTVGTLKASLLELLLDFGQTDRDVLQQSPETQPAGLAEAPAEGGTEAKKAGSRSTIELTWRGPLEVRPVEDGPVEPGADRRAHLLAKGSPVEMSSSEAGRVVCRELEYHDESKKIWLRGIPGDPVSMSTGPQQELRGETVFVDKKAGLASIEGAGRLVDRRSDWDRSSPRVIVTGGGEEPASDEKTREVKIAWSRSVEIEFGITEAAKSVSTVTSAVPAGTYIKHAVFDGDVTFDEDRQSIFADQIDVTFKEPAGPAGPAGDAGVMIADRIVATGHVHVVRRSADEVEHAYCDRLEVQMGTDDVGGNVPVWSQATGRIVAKAVARFAPGAEPRDELVRREIHANDELLLYFASVPRPISPREREELEAAARREKIEPGSARWNVYEQELLNRRDIIVTHMVARGEVKVRGVQDDEPIALDADVLDCTFGEKGERIKQALITGRDDRHARLKLGEFFVSGGQISADMATQSAKVPGAGTLQFLSSQDLDGRPVDEPIPVDVAWSEEMSLDGEQNAGQFLGDVRAGSESIELTCRKLNLRFESLPKPPPVTTRPAGPDRRWLAGRVIDLLKSKDEGSATGRAYRGLGKRPVELHAVGDAEILARVPAEEQVVSRNPIVWGLDAVTGLLTDILPALPEDSTRQATDAPLRLASRVWLTGPQIAIDLVEEHLVVEGAGKLQIEDYRLREAKRGGRSDASDASALDASGIASLEAITPSQTLFTWNSWMSFMNRQNQAFFDRNVEMTHLAGASVADLDRVAVAMGVMAHDLLSIKGREANLTCDRLGVEFDRGAGPGNASPSTLSRASRLNEFWASGGVVRLEEGDRFVMGTQIDYRGDSGIGTVIGSSQVRARLGQRDARTHRMIVSDAHTFEWNQKTGVIKVIDPTVVAAGE